MCVLLEQKNFFILLVSIQCLESVYNINRNDPAQVETLKCDKPLEEIFETATQVCGSLMHFKEARKGFSLLYCL